MPDPDRFAFRRDLADVALAGKVIASHYAEPLLRHVTSTAPLRRHGDSDAEVVAELSPGDELWMLDCTAGWAWGYAGADRRVGYVEAAAVGL